MVIINPIDNPPMPMPIPIPILEEYRRLNHLQMHPNTKTLGKIHHRQKTIAIAIAISNHVVKDRHSILQMHPDTKIIVKVHHQYALLFLHRRVSEEKNG